MGSAAMILLVALTIIFLVVTVCLLPYSIFSVEAVKAGTVVSLTALVALLVCLIPTTLSSTTLGRRRASDRVNLEVDVIAKYVERLMERS